MSYARLRDSLAPPIVAPRVMSSIFKQSARKAPMSPVRRRKLLFSYLPDWILTIVLAAAFFSLDKVEGYRRVFSLEDTSLRHPYAVHERIPNLGLVFICFVAPVLLQPIINLATVRSWWDLHNSTLGLILGLALTGAVTQFTKITVGRPRPDIVDRCQPPAGAVDPTFGLSNWTICTQEDVAILRDGFRSFPSGHSSLSFAGLGFLSFYLAGKLHLFDERGHAGKAWVSMTPFFGAALVAISRSMDYRHHWHDILIGSILGTVMSYFAYRQYYPSLGSELSHLPYSPRIKKEEDHKDILPTHHNPFQHQSAGLEGSPTRRPANVRRYTDEPDDPVELNGMAQRPDPGSLEEMWRPHHDQEPLRGEESLREVPLAAHPHGAEALR
ncbi:PAP2-domain-containing protein [Cylindrobasidium torrendii FP15055 ss-10]|uniref:PAP2-domain-containing protein n=1 Tax=Cylindrobasidium torrendii FP15055 ss-10 TaxID=1314674 RepID=A0A0D7BDK0_9AGAR|nr:PAP2-domain-containing protein [Cylindrobasidium torrendii FP15055 ss-10]